LLDDVAKARRSARTIIEEAPKQNKGSNGIVERAVWAVESQLRVMKNALEARIRVGIVASHCITSWLTEYVGYVINRLEIGKDGKTPYKRSRGKRAKVMGIDFGEKLLWMKWKGALLDKIDVKREEGVFCGE
jgi:hypothetical protein